MNYCNNTLMHFVDIFLLLDNCCGQLTHLNQIKRYFCNSPQCTGGTGNHLKRPDMWDTTPLPHEQVLLFLRLRCKDVKRRQNPRKWACSLNCYCLPVPVCALIHKRIFFPPLFILNPQGREYYPLHRALNSVKHEMGYDEAKKDWTVLRALRCWGV